MKPIKLEMTAFGSYAEPTVVPFDELEQGLYLITGDTGAGKTTIFDAIVFALYGKASGKDRTPEMMHCDLSDKSTDTAVKLRFSQSGKLYEVTRTIHFPKKRGSEGEYGAPDIRAVLTGEDLTPVEGASAVSASCEALLGLNAEQFRKIVMLAQGEFRDFLKADSEKKTEILGKLFDSSAYVWYQKLLDGARKRLEQRRSADREGLKLLLETRLVLPPAADPAAFLPDEPGLLENLDAILAEGRARHGALEARLAEAAGRRDELLVQQTAGRRLNDDLDRLAAGEARLKLLLGQTASMEARRAALARAELALHRALPALREAERAAKARQETAEALEKLERLSAVKSRDYQAALERRAGDEALAARRDEITALLAGLDRQLGLFAELAGAERDRAAALAGRAACQTRQQALTETLTAQERARRGAAEALVGLEEIDLRAAEALRETTEAGRVYTALAGVGGIRERYLTLAKREAELVRQDEAFRAYTGEVLAAREQYNALYRRFLAGQAGLLAGELRRVIETDGAGTCPVCGSRLGPERLDRLAAADAGTPDQEAVDAAKAKAEAMEQDRQSKKELLDKARSQFLSKKDVLVSQAAALRPDCESWELLAAPGWLDQAVAEASARSRAARQALDAARAGQQRRDGLRQTLADAETALGALRTEQEQLQNELTEREKALSAAEGSARLLRQQLRYETEAAAKAEAFALKSEYARLCNLLKDHEAREKQYKGALDIVNGQLRHAREQLTALEAALAEAEAAKAGALAETDFPDAAAVSEALLPCRGLDPELWLRRERSAISDYDHEKKSLGETTEALREQTAGRFRVDLAALESAFSKADAACQALRQESRSLGQRLESWEQVRAGAAERLAALAATEAAWQRLDRLGSFAAGSTGAGGKLSFERYVMGAVFREILELANRRLDRISGGRYQLEHKTAANRANAAAGLELEILDLTTGKRRPSASLSGGEAFYTSLALALGLSDVVQAHAGGMKLEALFIDEGFGSLDEDMLDNALSVLSDLTQGDRLVGIISHVDKLGASIPQKIVVKNGPKGSSLRVVL